jgi:hypothetical protein
VSDKTGRDGRGGARGGPRGPRPDAAREAEADVAEAPDVDTDVDDLAGDEAVPAYAE